MLHGEPTWSYLWRKVAPPVIDAGYRVILPDLPGFGRSDKPIGEDWYSYDRHVKAIKALVEDLDLRDATFVLHDWGGPIGLRLAVELADRVSKLVLMDTGLFTGSVPMSDAWHRFADFVDRVESSRSGCSYGADARRPRRRGGQRVRRAVPERDEQVRRAGVPADGAALQDGTGANATSCAPCTTTRAVTAPALGSRGPPAPAPSRGGVRGRAGPAGAPADRRRRPLSPGGSGRGDGADRRHFLRLDELFLGRRGRLRRPLPRRGAGVLVHVGDLIGLHRAERPRGRGAGARRRST